MMLKFKVYYYMCGKQIVIACNNTFSEIVTAFNIGTTAEDNKNLATTRLELNPKLRAVLFRLVAALVICFIIGLFSLPILFFYIRPSSEINMTKNSSKSMVCVHFIMHV